MGGVDCFSFWLLWIVLIWTFLYTSFENIHMYFLHVYLVKVLGHRVGIHMYDINAYVSVVPIYTSINRIFLTSVKFCYIYGRVIKIWLESWKMGVGFLFCWCFILAVFSDCKEQSLISINLAHGEESYTCELPLGLILALIHSFWICIQEASTTGTRSNIHSDWVSILVDCFSTCAMLNFWLLLCLEEPFFAIMCENFQSPTWSMNYSCYSTSGSCLLPLIPRKHMHVLTSLLDLDTLK